MTKSDKVTLYPGMAGVTRDMVEKMKAEGVELFSVDIMLTQKCNFRCIYCYAEGDPARTNELTMEEAKRVVRDSADLGARIMNMQGGEPLIWHPKDWNGKSGEAFFHIVEYIKDIFEKKGIPLSIVSFTDVAVVTKERAKRLAELGVSLCCKLDSLNEETQDKLLGVKGGAKKMMEGFGHLMEQGYGWKSGMPPLSTNTVVTAVNYDDVPDVFYWSRKRCFKPFVIPVHVHGRAREYHSSMLCGRSSASTLDSSDMKKLFEELAKIDGDSFGIFWKAESPWIENQACSRHLGGVHVRADGAVLPCSEAPEAWALGDIRKNSIKEIILSEKVKIFRNIYSRLHENSKCSPVNCPLSADKKCYGCRTRAYDDSAFGEDGKYDLSKLDPEAFFAGDPACWRMVRLAHHKKVEK